MSGRVKLQSNGKLALSEKIVATPSTKASVIKATQEGVERKIIFLVNKFVQIFIYRRTLLPQYLMSTLDPPLFGEENKRCMGWSFLF